LLIALTLPAAAFAASEPEEDKGAFISEEWELHEWIPIHLGPIDMSINKAVAYLLLGALCACLIGIVLMRVKFGREPTRRQALGETIYEIAQVQVAEQGLPTKAIGRWFPYVASLMIFIWTVNMLGFIPLPLSDEKVTIAGVELPTLAIFAATSTLSVTLALALMTFVFTHVEGIRANGAWSYFKSWIPDVPKGMLPLIVPLEILGQFMRLISLSVRLYANMLAGHMLILTFIGLIFLETHWVFPLVRSGDRFLPLRGRDRRLDPGVHLRRPVRHLHRLGDRARALRRKRACSDRDPCASRRRRDQGR
jgi:F-type H+-transporting ATPase subunit a